MNIMTCDDDIRNPSLFNFFKTKLMTNRLYVRGDGDDDDSNVGRATGRWHNVVGLTVDSQHGDIIAEYQIKNKRERLPPFYKNELIGNISLLADDPSSFSSLVERGK
jgi:hypothetical protein